MSSVFFLSLPASAVPGTLGEPETRLKNWIESQIGAQHSVASIALPDLKLGMLDNLVQQGEEVAKLDAQLQQVLLKCHDSISSLLGGDPQRIEQLELVDGRPAWAYLQQFGWNTAKYRPDKPIQSLLSMLSTEAFSAEQDLKSRLQSYQQTKQQLQAIDRKYGGDLSVRALDSVVHKSDLVSNSEFLVSQLVVVPVKQESEFLATYETLSTMVVPRSAHKITADQQYVLYSVTVFKKFAKEFETKCREARYIPRESPDSSTPGADGDSEAHEDSDRREEIEIRSVERWQRAEVEKLAGVTFSDVLKAWGHVKIIRVFVESVLRYGLPTSYVTASFEPKISQEKAEKRLIQEFAYLGGNAVERDSKGGLKETDLSEFAGLVEQDYRPFVIYIARLP